MRLSLRWVKTGLQKFSDTLWERFDLLAARQASVAASKKSENFYRKEAIKMVKIGDKVLVLARITQIVEDEEGVHYTIAAEDKKRSYHTMRIQKEDIQSCLEK